MIVSTSAQTYPAFSILKRDPLSITVDGKSFKIVGLNKVFENNQLKVKSLQVISLDTMQRQNMDVLKVLNKDNPTLKELEEELQASRLECPDKKSTDPSLVLQLANWSGYLFQERKGCVHNLLTQSTIDRKANEAVVEVLVEYNKSIECINKFGILSLPMNDMLSKYKEQSSDIQSDIIRFLIDNIKDSLCKQQLVQILSIDNCHQKQTVCSLMNNINDKNYREVLVHFFGKNPELYEPYSKKNDSNSLESEHNNLENATAISDATKSSLKFHFALSSKYPAQYCEHIFKLVKKANFQAIRYSSNMNQEVYNPAHEMRTPTISKNLFKLCKKNSDIWDNLDLKYKHDIRLQFYSWMRADFGTGTEGYQFRTKFITWCHRYPIPAAVIVRYIYPSVLGLDLTLNGIPRLGNSAIRGVGYTLCSKNNESTKMARRCDRLIKTIGSIKNGLSDLFLPLAVMGVYQNPLSYNRNRTNYIAEYQTVIEQVRNLRIEDVQRI